VGDERRLALLYLVTIADGIATGPHAVTPWRLGLIKELVAKVQLVFDRADLAGVDAVSSVLVQPEVARHVVPRPDRGEVRLTHRPGAVDGTHVVAVATLDRQGLLADLAGAFALARLSILSAQARTTEDGVALDEFVAQTASGDDVASETWSRLWREPVRAGRADARTAERLRSVRAQY